MMEQDDELVQKYAPVVWSLEFLSFALAFAVVAFVVAGITMHFGFIVASTIYCAATHDKEVHWIPRTIMSASALINRPRWISKYGL